MAGLVETYPQDNASTKGTASFLYNATRPMFERTGFVYARTKGKNHLHHAEGGATALTRR